MGLWVSVLLVMRCLWSSEHLGSACLHVADIYQKMTAKRSELEGSSDGGGRRGQQRCRLRLCYDFVAAGGVVAARVRLE
ncbi:hypothetical protein BHE74_00046628 [Ensete ventricosum]|nr:hypothetical protein GW17_00051862 [Ensete ventricosum]RWW47389.1 hypothetical protein BHE74_00046628 [Ensete ventricosum]RZS20894.1 hypothetical protein BHM03_00053460 [Ensete ventricosum]